MLYSTLDINIKYASSFYLMHVLHTVFRKFSVYKDGELFQDPNMDIGISVGGINKMRTYLTGTVRVVP